MAQRDYYEILGVERTVDAVVLKDELVRLVDVPLVVRLTGMPQVARGAQVKLDIVRWDEVDLQLEARLLEVASAEPDASLDYEEEADTGEAAVAEVVDISIRQIETSEHIQTGRTATGLFHGVARIGKSTVILLDASILMQ